MYKIVGVDLATVHYMETETSKVFPKLLCPKIYKYGEMQHYILDKFIHKEDVTRLIAILKHIEDETIFDTEDAIKEFVDSL